MNIEFTALTDRGKVRQENQDTICIPGSSISSESFEVCSTAKTDQPQLFAVFDGMGGESCGGEAAAIAARTLEEQPEIPLQELCMRINERICQYMKENEIKSMGTTAAIVRLIDDRAEFCNIGDSRIYLIQDLNMYRLSKDHTMSAFPNRRVLTQHLGIPPKEMLIEPYGGSVALAVGDVLLLCSDGLTDLLSEQEIGKIILLNNIAEATQLFKEEILRRGGTDNFSIILIQIQ